MIVITTLSMIQKSNISIKGFFLFFKLGSSRHHLRLQRRRLGHELQREHQEHVLDDEGFSTQGKLKNDSIKTIRFFKFLITVKRMLTTTCE